MVAQEQTPHVLLPSLPVPRQTWKSSCKCVAIPAVRPSSVHTPHTQAALGLLPGLERTRASRPAPGGQDWPGCAGLEAAWPFHWGLGVLRAWKMVWKRSANWVQCGCTLVFLWASHPPRGTAGGEEERLWSAGPWQLCLKNRKTCLVDGHCRHTFQAATS
jgi:hypothetical protein